MIREVPQDEDLQPQFRRLSAAEAQQLRLGLIQLSPRRVVAGQLLVGVLASLAAWGLTGQGNVGWSVAYGALAVVIPSALMAYGLTSSALSRLSAGHAQATFAGFLFWEGVKVLSVVAILWAAHRIVPDLNWLGLLAGLVLVLKVYWLGFWLQTRRTNLNG